MWNVLPRSTSGALRIVIIVVAGFLIWQFSDGFLLALETLAEPAEAQWFNVLSALCEGVLGPTLALSAVALSLTNQRLLLATVLAILAAVIYVAPLAAFFIGIMIYGCEPLPKTVGTLSRIGEFRARTDWV